MESKFEAEVKEIMISVLNKMSLNYLWDISVKITIGQLDEWVRGSE